MGWIVGPASTDILEAALAAGGNTKRAAVFVAYLRLRGPASRPSTIANSSLCEEIPSR